MRDVFRVRRVAIVIVALFFLMPAVAATAAEAGRTMLAQRGGDTVTPLRFLTREQVQCQEACRTRASQCHARSPSRPSKEACENTGTRCVEDCVK